MRPYRALRERRVWPHFHSRKLMPTVAYFYGIAIRMFFVEHPPPHFFASYSGHEANVSI
jgi:hypothetical protein